MIKYNLLFCNTLFVIVTLKLLIKKSYNIFLLFYDVNAHLAAQYSLSMIAVVKEGRIHDSSSVGLSLGQ
jgi:hypothetical protein